MALSPDTRLVQCDTIPSGEIDGELMALDAKRGEVIGLDPLGTTLWRMAKEPVSVAAMIDWATDHYSVEEEQAFADLTLFLEELIETGLLRRVE